MEHIVHLGAGAFIVALNPKWRTKVLHATSNANGDLSNEDDDEEDDDWMDEWVGEETNDLDGSETTQTVEIDQEVEFDAGDLLGKLLALITQVWFI